MSTIDRRSVLGLGAAAAAATTVLGSASGAAAAPAAPATSAAACDPIRRAYQRETARAGGTWASYVSVTEPDGSARPAVTDRPDEVVEAYSVNKIAVATAVLDKIDRGLLTLDHKVPLTAEIIIPTGDGIYRLHKVYGDQITLGNVMSALLLVSDDTAVRLCGLVCPALELNEILRAKGFVHTQVRPVANPNRFFLGKTTPTETHTLLRALVGGTLLSASSTEFLLTILRSKDGYIDGIRRTMSSAERERVATKAGWFADGRNEAGLMFDASGRPTLTYALFAGGEFTGGPANADNFGGTHPALQARARLGRTWFDAVSALSGAAATAYPAETYRASNGG